MMYRKLTIINCRFLFVVSCVFRLGRGGGEWSYNRGAGWELITERTWRFNNFESAFGSDVPGANKDTAW